MVGYQRLYENKMRRRDANLCGTMSGKEQVWKKQDMIQKNIPGMMGSMNR